MYLGKITIGYNASVGVGAIIVPGTSVPDCVRIGPLSSSWEIQDADESNHDQQPKSPSRIERLLTAILGPIRPTLVDERSNVDRWRGKTYEPDGVYVRSKYGSFVFLGFHIPEKQSSRSSITRQRKYISKGDVKNALQSDEETQTDPPTSYTITSISQDIEMCNSDATSTCSESASIGGNPVSNQHNNMSPFGRASYEHQAPYFVQRSWITFIYSSLVMVLTDIYWSAAANSSIQTVALVFEGIPWLGKDAWYDPFALYAVCHYALLFRYYAGRHRPSYRHRRKVADSRLLPTGKS
ncbi:hypothetical protein F5Y16DRAFT_400939 [Xylariaceae sp. FL0255]|nr:hypothetical protein F5Y16DRAFT_400939 [Xylariaceae sp. FL0255]